MGSSRYPAGHRSAPALSPSRSRGRARGKAIADRRPAGQHRKRRDRYSLFRPPPRDVDSSVEVRIGRDDLDTRPCVHQSATHVPDRAGRTAPGPSRWKLAADNEQIECRGVRVRGLARRRRCRFMGHVGLRSGKGKQTPQSEWKLPAVPTSGKPGGAGILELWNQQSPTRGDATDGTVYRTGCTCTELHDRSGLGRPGSGSRTFQSRRMGRPWSKRSE